MEEFENSAYPLFVPFAEDEAVSIHYHHLPHWEQPGRTYFITFRLADSLPASKLDEWRRELDVWRRLHPEPWSQEDLREYGALWPERIEAWLNAGHGSCLLRNPLNSGLVEMALRHFDGEKYWLGSFVVMPNHVHVLLMSIRASSVGKIVRSWKTFTAREMNRRENRTGSVWQEESFDHLVRNAIQLERFRRYITENPVKACLRPGEYILGEGKACRH